MTAPQPDIWTRLRELRGEIAQEGFWDHPRPEVVAVMQEFNGILRRLGGLEALDDPRGQL